MHQRILLMIAIATIMALQACNRKTVPGRTEEKSNAVKSADAEVKKADSMAVIRRAVKRKAATVAPKVIVVNDQYAKKSVDGRYYYDLQGHRYWKNNKDGKYYIFNKSMTTDPAFKKPRQ